MKPHTLRDLRLHIKYTYEDQIRDLCRPMHEYYRDLVYAAVEVALASQEARITVNRLMFLYVADDERRDPWREMPFGEDDVVGEPPEIAEMRRQVRTLRVEMAKAIADVEEQHRRRVLEKRKAKRATKKSGPPAPVEVYATDAEIDRLLPRHQRHSKPSLHLVRSEHDAPKGVAS